MHYSTTLYGKGGRHGNTETIDADRWHAPGWNARDFAATNGRAARSAAAVHGVGVADPIRTRRHHIRRLAQGAGMVAAPYRLSAPVAVRERYHGRDDQAGAPASAWDR